MNGNISTSSISLFHLASLLGAGGVGGGGGGGRGRQLLKQKKKKKNAPLGTKPNYFL